QIWLGDAPQIGHPYARHAVLGHPRPIDQPIGLRIASNNGRSQSARHAYRLAEPPEFPRARVWRADGQLVRAKARVRQRVQTAVGLKRLPVGKLRTDIGIAVLQFADLEALEADEFRVAGVRRLDVQQEVAERGVVLWVFAARLTQVLPGDQ